MPIEAGYIGTSSSVLVSAGVHLSVGINVDVEVQKDGVLQEEADVPSEGAKVVHGGCELALIIVGANPYAKDVINEALVVE